jgi:hypothetical protein
MSFCCALTKSKKPCKMRISENTELYNGLKLCYIHIKSYGNNELLLQNNIENQQLIQLQSTENIIVNTKSCISTTKSGYKCTKKTSHESG